MRRLLLPLLLIAAGCDTETKTDGTSGGLATTDSAAADEDGDGFFADEDCSDRDASINPGAVELCNGIDDNCDGQIDEGVMDVF